MPVARISAKFATTKAEGRAALVAYFMAGDPDLETSFQCMTALAANGADIIELGAPFTDPMADGPAIQAAGQRALWGGTRLTDALALARRFRDADTETPIILMGYANPVHKMGEAAFARAAREAGLDGAIIVDLPPEEDGPLRAAFAAEDLAVIRLATPTTDPNRMQVVARGASGFLYYVAVTGVTGGRRANPGDIAADVAMARELSGLPVCVGFGVKTGDQAAEMAEIADGVVVGSAFVEHAAAAADANTPGAAPEGMANLAAELSAAIRRAR